MYKENDSDMNFERLEIIKNFEKYKKWLSRHPIQAVEKLIARKLKWYQKIEVLYSYLIYLIFARIVKLIAK